jgi:site-specific DNA-methyltransferase (adenine-specific)
VQALPLDHILVGDCIEILETLPEKSVDLIFADPPYNLQLQGELWRPNMTLVAAVDDAWDQFADFKAYDEFTQRWLRACRRVLKDTGTIWVIGTYHNIYRVGKILQDLEYWILNDIIWVKTNPTPNFRGVRFTNAHETMLWAQKKRGARYTFNHHAMKGLNEELQMRSDWELPVCGGPERLKQDGKKVHSTQKPEALLYRVILASSHPGDVVLDPFFGSGTTGAVAKKLHRRWIGIEREPKYVEIARRRLDGIQPAPLDQAVFEVRDRKRFEPRLPFSSLLENDLLQPGQALFFRRQLTQSARLKPDGRLMLDGFEGSLHQAARHLMGGRPCNGWELWFFSGDDGELHPVDDLRQQLRARLARASELEK